MKFVIKCNRTYINHFTSLLCNLIHFIVFKLKNATLPIKYLSEQNYWSNISLFNWKLSLRQKQCQADSELPLERH